MEIRSGRREQDQDQKSWSLKQTPAYATPAFPKGLGRCGFAESVVAEMTDDSADNAADDSYDDEIAVLSYKISRFSKIGLRSFYNLSCYQCSVTREICHFIDNYNALAIAP
jgi:hypothetical protein